MRQICKTSLVFVAVLLVPNISCDESSEEGKSTKTYPKDNEVFVLSEDNFIDFLDEYPTALVEFYAPWCGHCKSLAPEWEKAAKDMLTKTPYVPLAKVDATVEVELAKKYEVQGYPTIKYWKDGEGPKDYDGPREHKGILRWISEKTDPNYKPPPESVITLTAEDFKSTVNEADIILVEFYAPWCGHCKQLAPKYEAAAEILKAHDPPILLAKVDATIEKDLAKEYSVTGFPTMKLFRKGRRFDYNGPRETQGIVDYMIEQSKPAARELKSVAEVQRFMSNSDISIIGFFATTEDKLFQAFSDAADARRETYKTIGYSVEPDVIKHFKAKPGHIGLYQPERFWSKYEPKYKFLIKPDASVEDITQFWTDNEAPLVGHRTQGNQGHRFWEKALVVVYYTVDFSPEHRKGTQYWRQKILSVANKWKSKKYLFAISDEDEFQKELQETGLGETGAEVNVIAFGKDGKKYPADPEDMEDFSEDTLEEFMEKLNTGRVNAFIKSQPAPKDDKGPVKTLVGSTFEKVVMDESKDVLVEFYAPWCGHCKQFEPVYKDLAKKLKAEKNLVIAKFDGTANDPPAKFPVEGFPTIYFSPAGKKDEPLKYSGGRTIEDVEKYLRENAKNSFKKQEL